MLNSAHISPHAARIVRSRLMCSLDIGDERTEAFELYEALRRLQRQGSAGEMLSATNPLLASPYYDDWDDDVDED
ncbi:toluene hydroxylase [Enterobacter roggenkampii]|nr:toluene hydroxylase [Enterobacter roggenkampii]